jgi:DNA-binding HxlR family transcriptional regulator
MITTAWAIGPGEPASAPPFPVPKIEERPLRFILDRVGDKWSVLIILELSEGALRFGHLRTRIDVSQKMLTVTLRSLLRDGLIERQVFPTTPPSVEYRLSPLGNSLLDPIRALQQWAVVAHRHVRAARAAYESPESRRFKDSSTWSKSL